LKNCEKEAYIFFLRIVHSFVTSYCLLLSNFSSIQQLTRLAAVGAAESFRGKLVQLRSTKLDLDFIMPLMKHLLV